ncbi:ATP-binding cassette domain-containing protein [Sansalvadorimonas sp. 2012CJ34-2]|uniref:ATP-binding protein Uup n=1 Tax=Parendozoicomonas callyspongiae TaxID=2942213 RepID=A0ABT0PBP3_9GAMM|nr:ATP-binding cassette domain-containing protein [Sansalvadorimonas sp. 2012CJ34-2]MCL6268769.1 ATP-binding cassette domain-containing protein [Sansalvadorimonas sp. 2012CJ34-2]
MTLLRFDDVSVAYGDQPLLDYASFQIEPGERVCLIGRNGAGKSTLMKLASGQIQPDDGVIRKDDGVRVGMLNQNLPLADDQLVYDVVASGLDLVGKLLAEWHTLSHNIETDADMKRFEQVQHALEAQDGWKLQQRVEQTLERLQLPADKTMGELSGGWRRRVELARALVCNPDILLLDEPTNHLDIVTIAWLEKQLKDFRGALLFITHDRAFLKSLATRILELDRGHLTSWDCNYNTYLERKAHALEVEQEHNAQFDKKLAQEEVWIRQGIKARRTRNEGRVRALKALRSERLERRNLQGNAKFKLEAADKSGKLVVEATGLTHGYKEGLLMKELDFTLVRGDKVGLIGANGVGKSTLLKILLGDLIPQNGKVKLGTKLEVAYFDQMRDQLDLEKTVIDNVAEGREKISINGRDRHVISYLEDFLFSPQRTRVPVKALSGGERNRLLLARLFSKPANILVLDEPTNDLDVETLELLESILVDFKGTVLLVSHDRDFLDNVVGSSLVFEGNGVVREYVGGFDDWLRQGGSIDKLAESGDAGKVDKAKSKPKVEASKDTPKPAAKKKLSYKLQRELDALPGEIEKLEQELADLEEETGANSFYQQDQETVQTKLARLTELNELLEQKMDRWAELEDML